MDNLLVKNRDATTRHVPRNGLHVNYMKVLVKSDAFLKTASKNLKVLVHLMRTNIPRSMLQ